MPPATDSQISAFVTAETKEQLEKYTRMTGVKKQHVINEALQHHLQALNELPMDIVVHPRLVLSAESGRKVLEAVTGSAPKPTAKLRALMKK
ncbi:MAG TPA: hypothetical protein VM925_09100 [Labilithrix sp.]|nr:hypothetical protein [Labilithrix sp.]